MAKSTPCPTCGHVAERPTRVVIDPLDPRWPDVARLARDIFPDSVPYTVILGNSVPCTVTLGHNVIRINAVSDRADACVIYAPPKGHPLASSDCHAPDWVRRFADFAEEWAAAKEGK